MKLNLVAVMSLTALVVAGCAGTKQVDLDANAMSGIHRITVVGPPDPVPMAVVTQNEINAQRAVAAAAAIPFAGVLGAAVAGGVAGGIAAEVARETSKPLNDEVAAEKYSYAATMRDELVAALKTDGYEVTTATVERKGRGFAEKLDSLNGQTDLIVDAVATATCSNVSSAPKGAGPDEKVHFRPVVQVMVRMTRPGQTAPIMSKTFVYDDALLASSAFQIKGDPRYDIADYNTLKTNIKGCLDGIKASASPLAKAVADVVVVQKSVASR